MLRYLLQRLTIGVSTVFFITNRLLLTIEQKSIVGCLWILDVRCRLGLLWLIPFLQPWIKHTLKSGNMLVRLFSNTGSVQHTFSNVLTTLAVESSLWPWPTKISLLVFKRYVNHVLIWSLSGLLARRRHVARAGWYTIIDLPLNARGHLFVARTYCGTWPSKQFGQSVAFCSFPVWLSSTAIAVKQRAQNKLHTLSAILGAGVLPNKSAHLSSSSVKERLSVWC